MVVDIDIGGPTNGAAPEGAMNNNPKPQDLQWLPEHAREMLNIAAPISAPASAESSAVEQNESAESSTKRPSSITGANRKIAVGLAGMLMLGGGGAFSYTKLAAEKPNTPVEAVDAFYRALANGDLLGVVETLDPGERAILIESGLPMVQELARVGGKANSDPKQMKVAAYTGVYTGAVATPVPLRSDLSAVNFQSGTFTTAIDLSKIKFPVQFAQYGIPTTGIEKQTMNLKGTSPFVARKVGNRWYVSLNYSVAELSRKDSQRPVPAVTDGVPAVGSATPEQAVTDMMQAMAAGNTRRMVELLPPDEFGALQNYIDPAKLQATWGTDKFVLNVNPKLRSAKVGDDRAHVMITDLPFSIKAGDATGTFEGNYADSKAAFVARIVDLMSADFNYDHGTWSLNVKNESGADQYGKFSWKNKTLSADVKTTEGSGTLSAKEGDVKGELKLADGSTGQIRTQASSTVGEYLGADGTSITGSLSPNSFSINAFEATGEQFGASMINGCLTIINSGEQEKMCGREEILTKWQSMMPSQSAPQMEMIVDSPYFDRFFPGAASPAKSKITCPKVRTTDSLRFTTVQRNGKWFVSPMRTMMDTVTETVKPYTPETLSCFQQASASPAVIIGGAAVGIVGAVTLLGQKVKSDFDTLSNTLPSEYATIDPMTGQPIDPFSQLPDDTATFSRIENTLPVGPADLPVAVEDYDPYQLPVEGSGDALDGVFTPLTETLPNASDPYAVAPNGGAVEEVPNS